MQVVKVHRCKPAAADTLCVTIGGEPLAVRLREVAARAGVSPRSVSNVINDFHHVSPAMRAKVQAAIDELEYQPNLLARSLRRGRTGTVGLLLPEIAVPYFGELAHQVVEQARELGLTVRIDETGADRQRELELLEEMPRSGHVDGILLSAYWLTGAELARIQPRVPLVQLGERATSSTLDHVGIDNVAAARDITSHLAESGRSRIAAIVEKQHRRAPTSRQRLKGYRMALRAAGLDPRPELVARIPIYPHRQDGANAMSALLAAGHRLDAVFCFTDTVATGALRALHEFGARVPDDVSVVGFDDVEESRFSVPSLTSVAPDKAMIARRALELLNDRINGFDGPPQDVPIPYKLVLRESTGSYATEVIPEPSGVGPTPQHGST